MTTRTYRIRGSAQEGGALQPQAVKVEKRHRVRPGTARDFGAGEFTAAADDVVRVELANGFALWSRADDLIREWGRRSDDRAGGAGDAVWLLDQPPRTPRSGSRGALGLVVKWLDFFGIDLSGHTARGLAERLEAKRLEERQPGLYRCALGNAFALTPLEGEKNLVPPADAPLLVFIHGTASNAQGSFGKLWTEAGQVGREVREALHKRYADRVYAWEHRSLTESPISNALELARRLPEGAEVHLVTHSRGGLIGELLCLGERRRDPDPLRPEWLDTLFAADYTIAEQLGLQPLRPEEVTARDRAYADDRKALAELLELLDQKQLKVRRFVRVACPARGTTLASGRLDRWLSVLDFLSGNGLLGDVVDFLLAVVKERTDPRTLPGLEAMLPGSALTRLLQHPDLVTAADLSVIAGDSEGDTLWGQIKLLAADWFFGADHDLVVNTGSMYGGLRRHKGGARFLCDKGAQVNHFNYFKNDTSLRWLLAGLTREEASDGGFLPLEKAKHEAPRWRSAVGRSRSLSAARPLAVVLPGTMGSALGVRGETVWLNYWALLRGGLKRLRMDADGVEATDLLDDYYGPLLEFLARSHRVEVFPYDWRRSVRETAERLADKLEDWLPAVERSKQPVHLVAHSMGGLVVRAMIADERRGAALWRRIVSLPNSRLLMLGTPNRGSHEALRWLTGHNPTQAKLSLLDITQRSEEIIDLVRHYPGLLELLPFDQEGREGFSSAAFWQALRERLAARWPAPAEQALAGARATWQRLRLSLVDPRHMVYVAGCQPATVVGYRLEDHDAPWLAGRKRLVFLASREGDGTVSWRSGHLDGVKTWYVEDAAHDELCAVKRAFPAYLDLLMSGTTKRLPDTPPSLARDAAQAAVFPLPAQPPIDSIPAEEDLRSFVFGRARPFDVQAAGRGLPPVEVCIRHGNLAYARHPVLVGHYLGDGIFSAERALDERLDYALSKQLRLGLYPGRCGSHAVFFNPDPTARPAGAVVIGLGQVGEITPGLLSTGVRDALLDYALRIAQWPDDRFGPAGQPRSAALTCLLVGTGAAGMKVRESLEAILRGAIAANDRLADAALEDKVLIDRIEILELYEDIAIAAAQALDALLGDEPFTLRVTWPQREVLEGEGRLRRVRCDDAADWWQRLEIVEDADSHQLRFIATTDRARAEVTMSSGQLRLAEDFIRLAVQSPLANPEAAKTLFEMLLPNRLKEMAPQQRDLVLLVDEGAARYPWELLEDRWSHSGEPPAIAAGLIRQLKSQHFRLQPAHATAPTALVVGNPDLSGWERYADLPGARQEASQVAAVLNAQGYRSHACIDAPADAILAALHQDAWRILHLAGHGEFEFPLEDATDAPTCTACGQPLARPRRTVSGMVIGRHVILTPGDIEQLRWVPELVFINCCHLGKTGASRGVPHNLLAASLAVQFIRMGVKAVVAAGWAVDDAAAQAFAERFYHELLAGATFGKAVQEARREIWTRYPEVNTWGAYQCYGDPNWRLRSDGSAGVSWTPRHYHAPAELIADLQNHTEWMRVRQRREGDAEALLKELREGIDRCLSAIPREHYDEWLARADVAAALGFAWGEMGAWAEAVECLEQALKADAGDCPLRVMEQLANFRVHRAWQDWRTEASEKDPTPLIEEVEAAINELSLIAQRAPTVDRFNLLGSACRRLAWMLKEGQAHAAPYLEALVNMRNYYQQALKLGDAPKPYPFAHWAVAEILIASLDPEWATERPDWREALRGECRRMSEVARARNAAQPRFWTAVSEAECELVMRLLEKDLAAGKLDEEVLRIVDLYQEAARRGASPREYGLVLEHLDFIIALGERLPAFVRDAVVSIRRAL